jgi:hypothetical protein
MDVAQRIFSYLQGNGMTFHIFNCSTDKSQYGVTDDPIGAKLPRLACVGDRWCIAPNSTSQRLASTLLKRNRESAPKASTYSASKSKGKSD